MLIHVCERGLDLLDLNSGVAYHQPVARSDLDRPAVLRLVARVLTRYTNKLVEQAQHRLVLVIHKVDEQLPAFRASLQCPVSYGDFHGLKHSVEVSAEGLDNATGLGCKTFREHNCSPALLHDP